VSAAERKQAKPGPLARGGASNRRRLPRVKVANLLVYSKRHVDLSFQHLGTAETLDLSESGLRLRVHESLPIGAELDLELKIAGEVQRLQGRILWGEEIEPDKTYEFGVRFVDVKPAVRDELRLYVSLKRSAEEED
jgi:hypothetical protein